MRGETGHSVAPGHFRHRSPTSVRRSRRDRKHSRRRDQRSSASARPRRRTGDRRNRLVERSPGSTTTLAPQFRSARRHPGDRTPLADRSRGRPHRSTTAGPATERRRTAGRFARRSHPPESSRSGADLPALWPGGERLGAATPATTARAPARAVSAGGPALVGHRSFRRCQRLRRRSVGRVCEVRGRSAGTRPGESLRRPTLPRFRRADRPCERRNRPRPERSAHPSDTQRRPRHQHRGRQQSMARKQYDTAPQRARLALASTFEA